MFSIYLKALILHSFLMTFFTFRRSLIIIFYLHAVLHNFSVLFYVLIAAEKHFKLNSIAF